MSRFELTAFLFFSLLALSHPHVLPPMFQDITPGDFVGLFQRVSDYSAHSCPDTIEHKAPAAVGTNVSSADIRVSGQLCTEGVLEIVDPLTANSRLSGEAQTLSSDILATIMGSDAAMYGIVTKEIKCGNLTAPQFPRGTAVMIFLVNHEGTELRGHYLSSYMRHMYIHLEELREICAYNAPLLSLSPQPSETVYPVSSPMSSMSVQLGPSVPREPNAKNSTEDDDSDDGRDYFVTPYFSFAPTNDFEIDDDNYQTPKASETESGDGVCFPIDATVKLENGGLKTMGQVSLGDRVMVSEGVYSDVFMFTHKDSSRHYKFVTLHTESGLTLSATHGHFIFVNGALAEAGTVAVGDDLTLADGTSDRVVDVLMEMKVGLYNPQTLHGDIVVNGLRASTYTRTVKSNMAHALLLPVRAVYNLFGLSTAVFDDGVSF